MIEFEDYTLAGYLMKVEVGEWKYELTFTVDVMLEMNLLQNHNEVICAYIADDLGEEDYRKLELTNPEYKCSMHELRDYPGTFEHLMGSSDA